MAGTNDDIDDHETHYYQATLLGDMAKSGAQHFFVLRICNHVPPCSTNIDAD